MLERQKEEVQHKELLAGIIASAVVNHSFNLPKQPSKPSDFMPSQFSTQPQYPTKRLARKAIARNIRCFLAAQANLRSTPTEE